jgi:hypothetical protein
MHNRSKSAALCCAAFALAALAGCSVGSSTPSAPTTPTPTPSTATPPIRTGLAAPVVVSPLNGTVPVRPALTVANAVRTGTVTGNVTYTFEVADNPGFSPVVFSGVASEGPGQTTLGVTADLAQGKTYYWRATATDIVDALTSPPSEAPSITIIVITAAMSIADQQGVVLWPGTQPTGTPGQARLGGGWGIGLQASFNGVLFLSPPIDALRVFDLMDRGFDPDSAIRWLNSSGYSSQAVYYPEVLAIGLPYQYIALVGGAWQLVHRVGA